MVDSSNEVNFANKISKSIVILVECATGPGGRYSDPLKHTSRCETVSVERNKSWQVEIERRDPNMSKDLKDLHVDEIYLKKLWRTAIRLFSLRKVSESLQSSVRHTVQMLLEANAPNSRCMLSPANIYICTSSSSKFPCLSGRLTSAQGDT